MRLGVFADAHGHAAATDACVRLLRDRGADQLLFLGDAIGYLGEGRQTIGIVESSADVYLMGNHEAYAVGRVPYPAEREPEYRIRETVQGLDAAALGRMQARVPFHVHRAASGGDVLFVHGSPWDPLSGYVYPDTDLSAFAHLPFRAVVMGHTHRPFVRRSGQTLVVNCGSCGLPRDTGDRGACALLDTETLDVEIVRFPIDAALALTRDPGIHPSVMRVFARRPDAGGSSHGGAA